MTTNLREKTIKQDFDYPEDEIIKIAVIQDHADTLNEFRIKLAQAAKVIEHIEQFVKYHEFTMCLSKDAQHEFWQLAREAIRLEHDVKVRNTPGN